MGFGGAALLHDDPAIVTRTLVVLGQWFETLEQLEKSSIVEH